jgi:pimeloyl-ACP methyl ester carboxylesterase
MQIDSHSFSRIFLFLAAAAGLAQAQTPPLQTSGVEVGASNERTTLVRATGKLSSTVDVKVKNTGDRPLLPPVHAVITFTPLKGGNLAGLTMSGALGGIGQEPYQTFFKDLSAAIGDGLAAGAETAFNFAFERPQDTSVSYAITIHGNRNRDPVASIGGPYSGQQGAKLRFDASGTTDPDGDALTFEWDFGDGAKAAGEVAEHAYAVTGLFTATLTVRDARGAVVTRETQVPLAPAGVFALARTRTLDGNGHPLGEVLIEQTGPDGARTLRSDAVSGFTSLGGAPGAHRWRFERAGFLTSYRKTTLTQGQVKVVAFPWLAALSTQRTPLSLLNPTLVKSATERVMLTFPPEAFEQVEAVAITELSGQTLPLPLPAGWSPLAAFHLNCPDGALADVAGSLKLLQAVTAAQPLALVRLDEEALVWQTVALLTGSGDDSVAAVLRRPGSYAVVLADTLPAGNPAAAVAGEPLPAGAAPAIGAEVTAVGEVNPNAAVASLDPARVTAAAKVDFTNGEQPLASGAWFLAEVEETYDLNDGRALKTPDYDATFYVYQHPGDTAPATATATFPLRPRILFGPDQLTEAHLKVAVLRLNEFSGGIVTPDGARLSLAGVRLGVPAGAVDSASAAELRLLSTASLSRFLGGFQALLAFDLNLPPLAAGTALDLAITEKLAPDAQFVLARCVTSGSQSGLQPVLRLRSDAQGAVTSAEPASGPKLPGITGSGQYVIVRIAEPEALVTGVVRQPGGADLAGALVRVAGEPWLGVTGAAGTFFTLAKPGERTVSGTDPATGDSGRATATLADASAIAQVEIETGPTGPMVIATTPVAGEARASRVAPVTIEFSEPIQPATIAAGGLRLRDVAANAEVPGSVTLELSNRRASFFPTNPLDFATDYQIVVSSAIRDLQNLPIEGTLVFAFKSQPSDVRPAGAQLVIFEPDAQNIPQAILDDLVGYDPGAKRSMVVAHGSPGTADPEVPVILVNETTGETATVLSRPDGSFANFLNAAAEDFITAVFVNLNGTRIEIPATKQRFDDGRTGLYKGGGILDAANEEPGKVQVIVEPGAVPSHTLFTLELMSALQLQELLDGTEPEGGGKVLAGIRYQEEGGPITAAADLSVDIATLNLPPGIDPATSTFALTVPVEIEGKKGFQIIDKMEFEPAAGGRSARLATHSPPFMGLLLRQLNEIRARAPFRDTLNRTVTSGFGSAAGEFHPISAFLIPVLVAPIVGQTVAGNVVSLREGETLASTGGGTPVEGAMVRFETGIGVIDASDPGLFRAGEMFTMTNGEGRFAITFPTSFNRQVIATHPRFPFRRATGSGIPAGDFVARTTLIFRQLDLGGITAADGSAPAIDVTVSPLVPLTGTGGGDGALLEITATDDVQIDAVQVTRQSFEDTNGAPLALETMTVPAEEGAPVTAAGRMSKRVRVQATAPGRGVVRISAVDGAGNITSRDIALGFRAGGSAAGTKRRLAFAWPPSGATGVAPGSPIRLRFAPPLSAPLIADFRAWLSTADPSKIALTQVEVTEDGREATVHYRLVSSPVNELELLFSTAHFDQRGGGCTDVGDARAPEYKISFAAEPATVVTGTPTVSGAGTAMVGSFVYALDRTSGTEGVLRTYKLQADGSLAFQGESSLGRDFGRPNDLVVIPDYPLREPSATALAYRSGGGPADVRQAAALAAVAGEGVIRAPASYVAAVGGDPALGARLAVFRVDATNGSLERVFPVINVPLTIGNSVVVKTKWSAPFLGVQEIAAGSTSVRLINFNGLVNGMLLRSRAPDLLDDLPANGVTGLDLDNDGAFVSAGEKAPLPGSRDGQVFGTEFSWAPLAADEIITDFDFHAGLGLLGATYRDRRGNGTGLMMVLGGRAGILDETTARATWPAPEAKRMLLLPSQEYFKADGSKARADLALVSTITAAEANPLLFVLDVTDPAAPVVVGQAPLPQGTGTLNTLVMRADGFIAASLSSGGVVLLDPRRLLQSAVGGVTPALVRGLPQLAGGGQRSFVADPSGVNAAANGGPVQAAITAPDVRIVTFDQAPFTVENLRTGSVGQGPSTGSKIAAVLRSATPVTAGAVFDPAVATHASDSARHHYVLIRAPGVAGETLPLAVAAVDQRGLPFVPEPKYLVPGVLGSEEITARYAILMALNLIQTVTLGDGVVDELYNGAASALLDEVLRRFTRPNYPTNISARRLSDDPATSLYNTYLAGPIILPKRDLSTTEAGTLLNGSVPRYCLAASSGFWAGLGPEIASNSLLRPFAATQNEALKVALKLDLSVNSVLGALKIVGGIYTGDPRLVLAGALSFVDFSLARIMNPGVTAYAHVGRVLRPPLIFIPGIMGSELVEKASPSTTLWLTASQRLFKERVKMLELSDTGAPAGIGVEAAPKDVMRRVGPPGLGVDVGEGLIKHFQKDLGYRSFNLGAFNTFEDALKDPEAELKRHPDLFPFPYDWRRDNAASAEKLACYVNLIQSAYPDSPTVDIVAHSMGGLVARRFILDHPDVVGRLITIASPFLGAPKSMFSKKTGSLDDDSLQKLVDEETGTKLTRYNPGLDQLFPTSAAYDLGLRAIWEDGADLDGDGWTGGRLGYDATRSFVDKSLFPARAVSGGASLPAPEPYERNNERFHTAEQDDWKGDTRGAQFFHIAGLQRRPLTIAALRVSPSLEPTELPKDTAIGLPPVEFVDDETIGGSEPILPSGPAPFPADEKSPHKLVYQVEPVRGAGDGTVPLLSATRGWKSGGDLNHASAIVIPVASASDDDDESVGHVPVMLNAATMRWVSRILTGTFRPEELPKVEISGSPNAAEGATSRLTAMVTPPAGYTGLGTPTVLWDLGDGRLKEGNSVDVSYPEDGNYTVTCTAVYGASTFDGKTVPKGTAGLTSTTFTVTNAAPQPVPSIVTNAGPGQPMVLAVNPGDSGAADQWTVEWDFGDGQTLTTKNLIVEHTYAEAERYTVTVKVTDDQDASGTGTLELDLGSGARLADRNSGGGSPLPSPWDDDPNGGLEFVEVVVQGIDPAEDLVRVFHDNVQSIGIVDGSVIRHTAGSVSRMGTHVSSLAIYRDVVRGGPAATSVIRVRAINKNSPVTFLTRYYHGAPACVFYHEVRVASTGDDVSLTLNWAQLAAITAAQAANMTAPVARFADAGPLALQRQPAFTLAEAFDGLYTFRSINGRGFGGGGGARTARDSTSTDGDAFETFISYDVTQVDGDPTQEQHCTAPEGAVFFPIPANGIAAATLPSDAYHAAARSAGGKAETTSGPQPKQKSSVLSQADADAVRNAVKSVFTRARTESRDIPNRKGLFGMFVLDEADVLIFEQGTGACLWKGDEALCNGAYKKGKSDNDYELFLPLFKSPNRFDPSEVGLDHTSSADREAFARAAHFPELMEGDWYFKLPKGAFMRDGELFEMGPVPEEEDAAVRATYLAKATHWLYELPQGAPLPVGGDWADADGFYVLERPADEDTVLFHPLTPAQIISFVLTQTVNDDEALKATLPDISFFPYRREHFDFAVMSLEKPPPFGDDPIGDAGMGRSSLLLKWVLEGAFLPEFDKFNVGMDRAADMARRTAVWNRLVARQAEAFLFDPAEWALYQEYALLNESADLRVRMKSEAPVAEGGTGHAPCGLFGNFLTAHDEKVMKKAGKAAIRALFGDLVSSSAGRAAALAVSPQQFLDDPEKYKSFEHFIAEVVKSQPLPEGIGTDDVDDFLGAKVANDATFRKIRNQSGGVDAFLEKAFGLLNRLQEDHAENFAQEAEFLRSLGRADERRARLLNLHAVEEGFDASGAGGEFRPGRLEMHGITGDHDAHYDFVVTLHNRSGVSVGPLDLLLSTKDQPLCGGITLNATDDALTIPNKDRRICHDGKKAHKLRYERAAASSPTRKEDFSVSFTGASAADNTVAGNDAIGLQSYFLDLAAFDARELAAKASDKRIYYRGIRLTDTEYELFKTGQLAQSTVLAPYHFAQPAMSFGQRKNQLLARIAAEMAANRAPPGFTISDVEDMSDDELMGVYQFIPAIAQPFIGVSAADQIFVPINSFATQPGLPGQKALLLVLELPAANPGIEYVRLAATTDTGERVKIAVNESESEVVFIDRLNFDRCDVYEVTSTTGPFAFTLQHLDTFTREP